MFSGLNFNRNLVFYGATLPPLLLCSVTKRISDIVRKALIQQLQNISNPPETEQTESAGVQNPLSDPSNIKLVPSFRMRITSACWIKN